jgi:hypothetical protein
VGAKCVPVTKIRSDMSVSNSARRGKISCIQG